MRPLWLLRTPKQLEEIGAAPHYAGPLALLSGPERIESGWWDQADARRDYYVVETAHGQRGWAFRERNDPHAPWMLHGWFG